MNASQLSFDQVFTPEQVKAIQDIIDERLGLVIESTPAASNYHTTPEIRTLIEENLQFLVSWLGADEFDISVLRHALARKATLRDGDKEIMDDGKGSMSRWDNQVLNAVCGFWPNAPIVPGSSRRRYKFSDKAYAEFSLT